MQDGEDVLLAVRHAERVLLEVLVARSKVYAERAVMACDTDAKAKRAVEIVLNCYRKCGCTSGQIKSLEKLRDEINGVLK